MVMPCTASSCSRVILALVFTLRKGKIKNMKWLQRLVLISPVFPFIAIQTGWFTAEVGRQPWVVYPVHQRTLTA